MPAGTILICDDDTAIRTVLNQALGRAGYAYWSTHHTLDVMTADYQRLLELAAARPAPLVGDLPAHFTDDYSDTARAILARFDISDF